MKSRFGAALEPFTVIRLDFYEKENRDLVTISRAEIVKSNFDLAAQLEVAEVLGYMAELIGEFAPPHEANDKLFRMINACVEAMAAAPDAAKLVLRYFEIWLLAFGRIVSGRERVCRVRHGADDGAAAVRGF